MPLELITKNGMTQEVQGQGQGHDGNFTRAAHGQPDELQTWSVCATVSFTDDQCNLEIAATAA